ncbi:S1 family peptidase [Streptomyces sp. NPDC050504]|uniref:S1 family peptidase n=1 Tax=Streptomyces sp. NPDC050504 TaxID=3365618 RepID=UPI00379217EB
MKPYRAGPAVALFALLLAWSGVAAPAALGAVRAVEVRGSDVLYASGGLRCTVGFNARGGDRTYAVVAGHCAGAAGTAWFADPALTVPVGVTEAVTFPGRDHAVIRYTNASVSRPGEVRTGPGTVRDITGAAQPRVGQSLCHVGRTSGLRCGTVTAVNVSVTYPEGTVHGLFRSNICTEPGDTGGPAFSGTLALGLIVGGSGSCASGGVTYYQPVAAALSAYGLALY